MTDSYPPAPPWRFSTRTLDLDQAGRQGAQAYYPLRMTVLGRAARFKMSIDAMRLGPVLVGDCRFDADIRMDFPELRDFYHVNIPLSGHLDSRYSGHETTATPRSAVAYGPRGDVSLGHWGADSRVLCVKIGRTALETELERLLHRPVRAPIALAPSIDLTRGYGRALRDLAVVLAGQVAHPEPLARQEIIGATLWHSLLAHVLAAADHEHRDDLLGPRPSYRPLSVKRVVDAIHAAPDTPFTAAALADVAGVGVRTLQAAFQHHLDMSPMAYLRAVRLDRAHRELLAADPSHTSVTAVAHRWGFAHLGRFADAYRRKYGAPPSATLRQAA